MSTLQPTNGRNPSNTLSCPHCQTPISSWAVFCSSCGERIEENREQENGDDVTQRQRKVSLPLQSELLPSLPATPLPAPSTSETWQQVPETEVPALPLEDLDVPSTPLLAIDTNEPSISQPGGPRVTRPLSAVSPIPQGKAVWGLLGPDRLWPRIVILSAIAAGLVNFVFTGTAIRPFIVFWFLLVCPGMLLVRFLRLKEPVVEWTLAVALSFTIDAIVAGVQLYAGKWSPDVTLSILIGFTLCGAIVQLALSNISLPDLLPNLRARKASILIPILLLVGILVGTGFWSFKVYHSAGSTASTPALPTTTSHSSSTAVPTPSPASSENIADLYYGTIYDIATNVTTEMSLTKIQLSQIAISGNFTGLDKTGTFKGTIDRSEHIRFTVKDSAGHLIFSFDGNGSMQAGGDLSGTYCSVNQQAQCTGGYGIWSVAPES